MAGQVMRRVRVLVAIVFWMAALPTVGLSPLSAQPPVSATLTGLVLTDSTEHPIANAEIAIVSMRLSVRSDTVGAFLLTGIAAGRHVVTVRALGYAEFSTSMLFAGGQRVEADLLLKPVAQSLAKIDVKATSKPSGDNPRIAEFDERRKMGFGRFLTQEVFEKAEGRKLGEVLVQRVPGLRTISKNGARLLVATRGVNSPSQVFCYVQVILDDIVQNSSTSTASTGFDIDSIDPDRVAAIEFYTVSNRPAQFNRGGAPCGTLVIWTRWGPSK